MMRLICALALTAVACLIISGCGQSENGAPLAASATPKPEFEHGHTSGDHGGSVVAVDTGDSYHAEAVVEESGRVRIYILGRETNRVAEADAKDVKGYLQPTDGNATEVVFRPDRQEGDAPGKTSQFVGETPKSLRGQSLAVTVQNLSFDGQRYRVAFAAHEPAQATAVSAADRAAYLSPGGKYTAADVAANGGVTPAEKFRGFEPSHNLKPKAGERICPVTLTKANPKCTWIVDGKSYEFCCPPCVEEFIKLAKEKPEEVKEPDVYRKQ
jgi:hypothetical protein